MSSDAEARPKHGNTFSASDPAIIAASEAALEALKPTDEERRIAALFADIDDETAQQIALALKAAR